MYQRSVLITLPKAQSIDIEFNSVTFYAQHGCCTPKKEILKGLSGRFKSGELTAIMGPSGAGKSTLLNILTGFRKKNVSGRISYIGSNGKQEWNAYKKESCYIQQDDQLLPLFTVNEAMQIAADLKLGASLNKKAKQMLIDDVLDSLDLSKTKKTRCNRLSGGQKKRLSIALELLDNPPVMFLDEPTTGLDSSSSLQVVSTLKSLAKAGRTIVCTIHQPSATIYEMFDHIYLVAEGNCVYQGAANNTVKYLNNLGLNCPKYHNPADYIIEVINKEYGNFNEQLAIASCEENWRAPPVIKNINLQEMDRRLSEEGKAKVLINPPSELSRFWTLLNRNLVQLYRDWTVTHLKLILHFCVGVLLGLLYLNAGDDGSKTISNVGFLLVSAVYLCYTSMMPAVLHFPSQLPVLKKEQFNNWYHLKTYYAAFLVANLPIQTLFAIVYCSISYFLSSQPLDWNRFLMFLAIAVLTTLTAESIGLVLGTTVNPINGTFLGAISTAVMLTFAGFFVLFNHMPTFLYYLSYLSYLRYSLEGLVQAVYGFNRGDLNCPEEAVYCHYRVPKTILNELAMTDGKYWVDIVFLSAHFVVLRIIGYCTLRRKLTVS
ncbi:ATP-binding cassette sub-family G member 4-like [Neodiprion virginianus]|uniref:ATP-binding cassette sub-family G member 4-like n=1 Tax=Neodiprion virginianus TaxID=2961670 RepID=UPI001EE699C8|nr:ATP-binding cassette sub-family G member 4-like [Neodiprion virginianus]